MENNITSQNTNLKIYTKNAIDIATFFGGPLGGIYMIHKNYVNLGKNEIAKKFLKNSLVIVLLFFFVLLLLPDDIINKLKFGIGLIAFFAVHNYMSKTQVKELDEYLKFGGKTFSTLNGFGVFFLSIFLQFALIFLMAIILYPIIG